MFWDLLSKSETTGYSQMLMKLNTLNYEACEVNQMQ